MGSHPCSRLQEQKEGRGKGKEPGGKSNPYLDQPHVAGEGVTGGGNQGQRFRVNGKGRASRDKAAGVGESPHLRLY